MNTIERLKELSSQFGLSIDEVKEILNALPKLLAVVDAAEGIKQRGHEVIPELLKALTALEEKL